MKQNAYIAGVGVTSFGNHSDRGLKSLAADAVSQALKDAGISKDQIQAAWLGNVGSAVLTGQMCIGGQVILGAMGFKGLPIVNVKNACATASTAFHEAATMVSLGAYDVVLAGGVEKLYNEDKSKTFAVIGGCLDVEDIENVKAEVASRSQQGDSDKNARKHSFFMDIYASLTLAHMEAYGTNQRHFAKISAKNSRHGQHNPNAQFRAVQTADEVLSAREITYPLTLPMCSPIGDGAAAAVIVSEKIARQIGLSRCVRIRATELNSAWPREPDTPDIVEVTSKKVYEQSGIGPSSVDVVELHDATSPSELMHYEALGLCPVGNGGQLVDAGETEIGGRIPVNPSGGLLRRGHPIGASGLAQIHELTTQLRGEASARQVDGARIALAENGGGYLNGDAAAMVITLLEGPSK